MRILFRHRQNIRLHIEKFADLRNRQNKTVRHLRQGSDEKIAKCHAIQLGVARRRDPMLHDTRQQGVVIERKRRQGVADIARGWNLGEFTHDAGTATRVGDGDDAS